MEKGFVIYNPLSGDGKSEENSKLLEMIFDEELEYFDITRITNYKTFFGRMEEYGFVIIAGGDGTLNRFINDTEGIDIPQEIFYFPTGNGNDFANDMEKTSGNPFKITEYLKNLPIAEVKGKKYRFINGVGFGIDGYCCQVGDELKKTPEKKADYTKIAIKGLLFDFAPRNAKVTVDGVTKEYKKVWIAPTMKGRYYGGGMFVTPEQDRFDPEGKVSFGILHNSGALHTLMIFPSIFQGKHVEHTKQFESIKGHEVTVEFDRPTALQIDGETVLGVTSYTVKTGKLAQKKETATAEV